MNRPQRFTKVDLKPRRYHFYAVFLFILGTLLPPLAVAARFGIGKDFYLNVILTLCGYIPGHGHNFYIQNIRNNKNNRRTPKWASRYGLIDTSEIERKRKRSEWAHRYNDRLPNSNWEGRAVEEGQIPDRSAESLDENGQPTRPRPEALWNEGDESFYNRDGSSVSVGSQTSSGRWHYPANFDDTDPVPVSSTKKKKKKEKKDRWARTEDARMGVGLEDGTSRRKKKKKSKVADNADFINPNRPSLESTTGEGPEDPERMRYERSAPDPPTNGVPADHTQQDAFNHEF